MEQDFLTNFITKIQQKQEQKDAEEKRKNHFRTIGKKGGLAKKKSALFSKTISAKLTEKELKVNEFKTDEVLLSYGNNFNRIKNLLRNREFSSLENKAEIMREIEGVTKLIYNYLYQNRVRDE